MRANCNIAKLVHHQNWNYLSIVQVIGYSSNLTLFISPTTVGQYTCHVAVPGYKTIHSSAHVWARGPPEMVLSAQSRVQHGSLGDTVQVQCEARSVPKANGVIWKFKDYPVNTRYREHENLLCSNLIPYWPEPNITKWLPRRMKTEFCRRLS